jgi:hypothetical protein
MNLGIIITGEIRSFFIDVVKTSFINMVNLCKMNYQKILFFVIISDENYDKDSVKDFFTELSCDFVIVDFINYETEYIDYVNKKMNTEQFKKLKEDYFSRGSAALNYVYNIEDNTLLYNRQPYQLKVGIKTLLDYENEKDCKFDIIMRTRFDMTYSETFFPYLPSGSIFNKLLFDDELKSRFLKKMKKYNIPLDYHSLVDFIKTQKYLDSCSLVNLDVADLTLGGHFCYNYPSVENIINGSDDILYMFNDFYYFSKREIFLKLYNFLDDYYMIESKIDIPHFYVTESQYCIFCYKHNINFVMYHPVDENGRLYEPYRI